MNICMNCKHLINKSDHAEPIWYDLYCSHTSVKRVPAVDCVSGAKGFASENDLDVSYVHDSPYPFARDINTNGRCKLYENKSSNVVQFHKKIDWDGEFKKLGDGK